jgi:homoserine O-acetyltransferase
MHAMRTLLFVLAAAAARAQAPEPAPGDAVLADFHFARGETLPKLKIHYVTFGKRAVDSSGHTTNAVLVLHGTGGSSKQFLVPNFQGVLFGPGQLLDAQSHFIVIPDGIGHGGSTKPSDGMHAKFPRYTYADMVAAQHRLLTEHLGVDHLRLLIGTSMGGMHTWVWGENFPDFMDALMPLASLPAAIAGRNRMWRKMAADLIRDDPDWRGGDYEAQPRGLKGALSLMLLVSGSPKQWLQQAPDRAAADAAAERYLAERMRLTDANDLLFALEASREYDPAPLLDRIRAPLLALNFADDAINPPELGVLEQAITKVKNGKAVVFPLSEKTRGHQTHTWPELWQSHLAELLAASRKPG